MFLQLWLAQPERISAYMYIYQDSNDYMEITIKLSMFQHFICNLCFKLGVHSSFNF